MVAPTPDWADLDRRGDALAAAAEESVVRWCWARSSADWETPFELWEQRFGRNPVTKAVSGSPDPELSVHYGYDANDQIVLARRFTAAERKEVVPESDMVWTSDTDGPVLLEIEHRWRPEHRVLVRRIIRPEPPDRRTAPNAVTTFWRPGTGLVWQQERYDRGEAGRVERITHTSRYDEHHASGAHERTLEYVVTYDELGTMDRVTSQLLVETSGDESPSDAAIQWVRSTAATIRDAEALLARELPARIVDWVRRNDPKAPVYAIGLLYGADTSAGWMPSLTLATVQHLRQARAQRTNVAWNPAAFAVFDPEPAELRSPAMLAAFRITGQAWGDRSAKKAGTLLKKVAKEIEQPVRETLAQPINEFAAYAVELEDDFEKAAKSAFGARAQRAIMDL